MAIMSLSAVTSGSNVFVDANILIYGLNGQSSQCHNFLERCSREEITGITLFALVNEATHRFMLAEAAAKGFA